MDEDEVFCDVDPNRARRIGDEPPSETVVRIVAEARSCDPLDLPPLHDVVDPDALDDLFGDEGAGRPRGGRLAFEYGGCTVALVDSNEVRVVVNE